MQIVKIIFAAAILGCLIPIAFEGTLLLRESRIDEDKITGEVAGWNTGMQKALGDFSAASLTFAQVAAEERNAFAQQNRYYLNLGKQTSKLLEAANGSINRLDSTLDDLAGFINDSSDTVRGVSDGVRGIAKHGNVALSGLSELAGSLTADADAARVTIQNASAVTANTVSITQNLDATTKDVRDWVHTETQPVKGAWHVIKTTLFELLGPLAEVVTSIR